MIFIDQLVMSADWVRPLPGHFVGPLLQGQRRHDPDAMGPHPEGAFPAMCGVRRLSYREEGDIDFEGNVTDEPTLVSESQSPAWLHGSHETRLQVKSDGKKVLFAGNPGRFGRPDNIFNLDLDESIKRSNEVLQGFGFPPEVFHPGQELPIDLQAVGRKANPLTEEKHERRWTGARVWGIHLTQNYATGSPTNLQHTMNWLATQSMKRVTSKRRGASTLEFGKIGYCQTQLYDKAAEILAHTKCKREKLFLQGRMSDDEEREFIDGKPTEYFPADDGPVPGGWVEKTHGKKRTEAEILGLYAKRRAWKYAHENGLLRVEVKCAKDFLVHKGLTYLGAWDMGKVVEIFKERTEIVARLEVEVDELDVERLPKALRVPAAAWLAGVDLRTILPKSTFHKKANALLEYGLDVHKKRELSVVRPIMMKQKIEVSVATPPDWYRLHAA